MKREIAVVSPVRVLTRRERSIGGLCADSRERVAPVFKLWVSEVQSLALEILVQPLKLTLDPCTVDSKSFKAAQQRQDLGCSGYSASRQHAQALLLVMCSGNDRVCTDEHQVDVSMLCIVAGVVTV
jgi:hypothetical protein